MDTISLPNHVIDSVERRWAAKLERDARLWKQKRGLSNTSPVRRNRWETSDADAEGEAGRPVGPPKVTPRK